LYTVIGKGMALMPLRSGMLTPFQHGRRACLLATLAGAYILYLSQQFTVRIQTTQQGLFSHNKARDDLLCCSSFARQLESIASQLLDPSALSNCSNVWAEKRSERPLACHWAQQRFLTEIYTGQWRWRPPATHMVSKQRWREPLVWRPVSQRARNAVLEDHTSCLRHRVIAWIGSSHERENFFTIARDLLGLPMNQTFLNDVYRDIGNHDKAFDETCKEDVGGGVNIATCGLPMHAERHFPLSNTTMLFFFKGFAYTPEVDERALRIIREKKAELLIASTGVWGKTSASDLRFLKKVPSQYDLSEYEGQLSHFLTSLHKGFSGPIIWKQGEVAAEEIHGPEQARHHNAALVKLMPQYRFHVLEIKPSYAALHRDYKSKGVPIYIGHGHKGIVADNYARMIFQFFCSVIDGPRRPGSWIQRQNENAQLVLQNPAAARMMRLATDNS